MSLEPINIQISGKILQINCPLEEQDALNKAADDLNKRLESLKIRTNISNTEKLIFIVALNVCNELIQEKLKTQQYSFYIEKKIRLLQKTLENVLIEENNIRHNLENN